MKHHFLLAILVNAIILLNAPQARAQTQTDAPVENIARYTLYKDTLERGYPASSYDGRFTLLIFPGILKGESAEVEIEPFVSESASAAYRFSVTENGQAPLIQKPFTAVLSAKSASKYARLYYYHAPKAEWLALTTIKDKERGLVLSNRIDFAQAVIGLFSADSPLPDTILEKLMNDLTESETQPLAPQGEPFTAVLENDILKNDYAISVSGASLLIPAGSIPSESAIFGSFDKQARTIDFAIKPFDPKISGLRHGAFVELTIPIPEDDYKEYTLVFWDNNAKSYRELQTAYDENGKAVRAKTPFHFGKYSVIAKEEIYRGNASWFRDTLLDRILGAASNDYEKGARLKVTNVKNGKSVEVEVRSVGPFVSGRIIDLTKSAFSKIASPKTGVVGVRVERIS